MILDNVNQNKDILYDHRNLVIQVRHKGTAIEDSIIYVTYYSYDEAGNRFAKTVYKYKGPGEPSSVPTQNDAPSNNDWVLHNQEFYSRDVSGRELAIYQNDELKQYPVYGLDLVGFINSNNETNYYLKDHLGSVRVIVDYENRVISSQDYDPWGYLLSGRAYESQLSDFKFTSKERDIESNYDYFGARYYDSRIGRWGGVDPVSDFEPSLNPYHYTNDNPLKYVDPNGMDYIFYLPGSNSEGLRILHFGEDEYYFYSVSGDYSINATGDYSFLNGLTFFKGNSKTTKDYYFRYSNSYSPGDINIEFESIAIEKIKSSMSNFNYTPYTLPYGLIQQSRDQGFFDYKAKLNNGMMYFFDGFVYNKEEIGNVLWGVTMARYEVPQVFSVLGADAYTVINSFFNETNVRRDEA